MHYIVNWCKISRRMKKANELRNVHYGKALYRLHLFSLAHLRIRSDISCMNIIVHLLLDIPRAQSSLGFELILSRFINSGVTRIFVSKHIVSNITLGGLILVEILIASPVEIFKTHSGSPCFLNLSRSPNLHRNSPAIPCRTYLSSMS